MRYKKWVMCIFLLLAGCGDSLPLISWQNLTRGIPNRSLKGLSVSEISDRLGEPVVVRRENNHEMHCYRNQECVTLVFFDEKGVARYIETRGLCDTEKHADNN